MIKKAWKYLYIGVLLFFLLTIVVDNFQEPVSIEKYRKQRNDLKFIKLSKGVTRYELNGQGPDEITVFIHGGGILGSEVFKKNIARLNKSGISTLVYDQYGRGYSDRPKIDYSSHVLVGQFKELLDSLGLINKEINLVALSMGTVIAWKLLRDKPANIRKIILISPSLFSRFNPKWVLKVPVLNYLLMTWYWRPQYIKKRRREFYNRSMFKEYGEVIEFFSRFRGFKRIYRSTWTNIMAEHCMPEEVKPDYLKDVYLIFGKNDPYLKLKSREHVSSIIRDAPIFVIPDAGHMPNFEQSEQVNQLLIDILKNDPMEY